MTFLEGREENIDMKWVKIYAQLLEIPGTFAMNVLSIFKQHIL